MYVQNWALFSILDMQKQCKGSHNQELFWGMWVTKQDAPAYLSMNTELVQSTNLTSSHCYRSLPVWTGKREGTQAVRRAEWVRLCWNWGSSQQKTQPHAAGRASCGEQCRHRGKGTSVRPQSKQSRRGA